MPVSGLVLTLSRDPELREAALTALRGDASIEMGGLLEHRLPIAVDTPTSEADHALWQWLHALPGVLFVDLVSTDTTQDARVCAQEHNAERGRA